MSDQHLADTCPQVSRPQPTLALEGNPRLLLSTASHSPHQAGCAEGKLCGLPGSLFPAPHSDPGSSDSGPSRCPDSPTAPALSCSLLHGQVFHSKGQGARACLQGRKPPLDSLERREKCNPEISRKEKSKRFSPTTSSFNDLFTPHWQYVLITCFESGDTICGAPAMHQTSF